MNNLVPFVSASPTFWALLAAIPAVANEYMYKLHPESWINYIHIYLPSQMLIGYSIYRLVTMQNTTLIDAFIIWAFATTFMRVFVVVFLLHESVKLGTWYALGLIIMARVAQTFWGR